MNQYNPRLRARLGAAKREIFETVGWGALTSVNGFNFVSSFFDTTDSRLANFGWCCFFILGTASGLYLVHQSAKKARNKMRDAARPSFLPELRHYCRNND